MSAIMSDSTPAIRLQSFESAPNGSLIRPIDRRTLHSEMVIMNMTAADILVVNSAGQSMAMDRDPTISATSDQFVRVEWRSSYTYATGGIVARNRQSTTNRDTCTAHRMYIPLHVLAKNPVFVKQLGLVIALMADAERALPPNTEASLNGLIDDNIFGRQKSAYSQIVPFVISANDPDGRYTELFVLINDEVMAVPITKVSSPGLFDHSEHVVIRRNIRAVEGGMDSVSIVGEYGGTTFDEIVKMDATSDITICNGFPISLNRDKLISWHRRQKAKQFSEHIAKAEHDAVVKEIQNGHVEQLTHIKAENARLKSINTSLGTQLKDMESGDYHDKRMQLRLDEQALKIKQMERDTERLQVDYEMRLRTMQQERDRMAFEYRKLHMEDRQLRRKAKVGFWEGLFGTFSGAVKAIAIIIPSLFGLYKILSPKSA